MGDRVGVTLTILACHQAQAESLMTNDGEVEGWYPSEEDGEALLVYTFTEVNYGELICCTAFRKAGIPYHTEWDAGGGFQAGKEFSRYTKNGENRKNVVDADTLNPTLESLEKILVNPEPLENLRRYLTGFRALYRPLPWANQEEYAKRFLALQLIDPS